MALSTSTYIIQYVRQNVPSEILQLAFKPQAYNTTVEQRIMTEVVEASVLQDINLVGGKRKDIFLSNNWKIDVPYDDTSGIIGGGLEPAYYLIPAEAREGRNISSVIAVTPFTGSNYPGAGANFNGQGSYGNTATGMLSQMMNTRTFAQYPIMPQATLEGTNIVRVSQDIITDGLGLSVFLEMDLEMLNLNKSGLMAVRKLCLCAVQRYIATNLRIPVDETEVVAGMEIGVIKTIVEECLDKAKDYDDLLVKMKGAMHYDPRSLSKIIYNAL